MTMNDPKRQRDSIIARLGNRGHVAGLKDKLDALMKRVHNTNRSTEQDVRRGERIVARIKKLSVLADPNNDIGYLDQHIRTLRSKLDKASQVDPPSKTAIERISTTLKFPDAKTQNDHARETHRNLKRQVKLKIIDENVSELFIKSLNNIKESRAEVLNKSKPHVLRIDDKAEAEEKEEMPKKPKGHPTIHTAKTKSLSEARRGVRKNNPAKAEVKPSIHKRNDKPKQDA